MNFIAPIKCSVLRSRRLSEILKWDMVGSCTFLLSYYDYFLEIPFQSQMSYSARISQCWIWQCLMIAIMFYFYYIDIPIIVASDQQTLA